MEMEFDAYNNIIIDRNSQILLILYYSHDLKMVATLTKKLPNSGERFIILIFTF